MPVFSRQFNTGIPDEQPDRVPTKVLPVSIPGIKLPDSGNPSEDPSEKPTNNPKSTPTTKPVSQPVSQPKSTNIWGTIGHDIGIGAGALATVGGATLGIGKALGSGLGSAAVDVGKEGLELGSQAVKYGMDPAVNTAKSIVNSDQFKTIGSDFAKIGEGAGEGFAIEAPLAAGTEAIGGGPEDPFADIAAGAEEATGGIMGAGQAAIEVAPNLVKNMFSLAA